MSSGWVLADLLTRKIKLRITARNVLGTLYRYLFETVRIRILIKHSDPDPYKTEKQGPYPYQSEKQYPESVSKWSGSAALVGRWWFMSQDTYLGTTLWRRHFAVFLRLFNIIYTVRSEDVANIVHTPWEYIFIVYAVKSFCQGCELYIYIYISISVVEQNSAHVIPVIAVKKANSYLP